MIGTGQSISARTMRSKMTCWRVHASSVMPRRSFRSPPAQNAFSPVPVRTMQRSDFGIERDVLETAHEIAPHLGVQRVGSIRPVEPDDGDVFAGLFEGERLETRGFHRTHAASQENPLPARRILPGGRRGEMRRAAQRLGVAIALQEIAPRRRRLRLIDVELRRQFRIARLQRRVHQVAGEHRSSLPRPKVKATWPGVWPGVGRMRA